jgi:hypothetical protein
MSTYSKQMQKIVDDYRAAGEPWPTSARNIADWAILTGRWIMPTSAIRRRCADDLAAAMREEYYTDRRGRRVRVLHPAPLLVDGQREMIWDDIRTATRPHMQLSFQNRRQGIVGDCRQFKVDVDSYNESHPDQEPIQIVFNFERDLAEFDAADSAA